MIVQQDVFLFFLKLGFKRGGGSSSFTSSYFFNSGSGFGVSINLFDVVVGMEDAVKLASASCLVLTF